MKNLLFGFVVLVSAGLCLAGCSSDNDDDNVKDSTPVTFISDVTGLLSYNMDEEAWHFVSSWPYSPVGPKLDLYPIELSDDFKTERLLVTISGNTYIDEEEQKTYIEITKIRINTDMPIIDREGYFPLQVDGCFSACVTDAKADEDSIKAILIEIPDSVPFFAPHKSASVYLFKSDLQNLEIREGDVVDFRVVHFKMLHIIENGPETFCDNFICRVKPCK